MTEQVIAGVVGVLCGFWVDIKLLDMVRTYGAANKLQRDEGYLTTVVSSIAGAYLFIKWFC